MIVKVYNSLTLAYISFMKMEHDTIVLYCIEKKKKMGVLEHDTSIVGNSNKVLASVP